MNIQFKPFISKLIYCALIFTVHIGVVGAACDSMKGVHYPTNQQANYYGAASTEEFYCAVTGIDDVSAEQLQELTEYLPPKLSDRFYVLLGGNVASEGIYKVKNVSDPDSIYVDAEIVTQTAKTGSNNFEVGFGYTWTDFAIDVEYLPYKSIQYSTTFTGVTGAPTVSSTVSGYNILANVYWIFNDMYNVKLYGVIPVGLNNIKSVTTANSATFTLSKYSAIYGLGIGGRFNVVSSVYADMVARYMLMGNIRMQTNTGIVLKSQLSWFGVSLRLLWLW